jgi:hypothetical protein
MLLGIGVAVSDNMRALKQWIKINFSLGTFTASTVSFGLSQCVFVKHFSLKDMSFKELKQ